MTSIHIIMNTRLLVSLCMVADKGWDWGTEQGRQVEGDTVVVAATCERSKCGARLVPVWWAVGGGWWWWWLVVGGGTMGVGRWVVGLDLLLVGDLCNGIKPGFYSVDVWYCNQGKKHRDPMPKSSPQPRWTS